MIQMNLEDTVLSEEACLDGHINPYSKLRNSKINVRGKERGEKRGVLFSRDGSNTEEDAAPDSCAKPGVSHTVLSTCSR